MPLRLCVSLRLPKSSNAPLIGNAKTRVFQHHDHSRPMKVSIRQAGRSRLIRCLPRPTDPDRKSEGQWPIILARDPLRLGLMALWPAPGFGPSY